LPNLKPLKSSLNSAHLAGGCTGLRDGESSIGNSIGIGTGTGIGIGIGIRIRIRIRIRIGHRLSRCC
jgi:hypothetical protein